MSVEKIIGTNNKIVLNIADNKKIDLLKDGEILTEDIYRRLKIMIIGNNNRVSLSFKSVEEIEPLITNNGFNILIIGDNNTVDLGTISVGYMPDWNMRGLNIIIGGFADNWSEPGVNRTADNCRVEIGNNVMVCGAMIYLQDDNSHVTIGDDCMISWGIDIWCTDVHTIMDLEGNPRNFGEFIEIGKHVWIGKDSKIGKNVRIADNCIVGWGSIVTKGTDESNVILAGVPAKIIKRDIDWNSKCINRYIAGMGKSQ